ncbi:MAG: VanZ family protein [Coriobacteriia bacterium]|nr:VanZ family protein [Coriobacteriia bacterium]
MNEFFAMTIGRAYFTLAANPASTALAVFASFILCLIFQVTILRRENMRTGKALTPAHFAWTTLFIFYLLNVYRVTGMGTLWSAINNSARISSDTIHLTPFASFSDGRLGLFYFALNVLMTIPLGLFLAALWPSMRSLVRIAATGLLFSLAIELSQLFTLRGSNVDDLIANTLGAVIGYLIYGAFSAVLVKRRSTSKTERYQQLHELKARAAKKSKVLRNEGLIYVALSFLGMFLFFNATAASQLDLRFGLANNAGIISTTTTDPLQQKSDLKGTVVEAHADSLVIEIIDTQQTGDGSLIAVNTDSRQTVYFSNMTGVDIWRIDEFQIAIPVAIGASPFDIRPGDMVDITWPNSSADNDLTGSIAANGGRDTPARHIVVWRFPR